MHNTSFKNKIQRRERKTLSQAIAALFFQFKTPSSLFLIREFNGNWQQWFPKLRTRRSRVIALSKTLLKKVWHGLPSEISYQHNSYGATFKRLRTILKFRIHKNNCHELRFLVFSNLSETTSANKLFSKLSFLLSYYFFFITQKARNHSWLLIEIDLNS